MVLINKYLNIWFKKHIARQLNICIAHTSRISTDILKSFCYMILIVVRTQDCHTNSWMTESRGMMHRSYIIHYLVRWDLKKTSVLIK